MKWLVRFLGLVLLVGVMLVALVVFLPAERIARIATEKLSSETGRQVSIGGDVSISLWPVLGVTAQDLKIGNPEWASTEAMFQAATAAIGIDAVGVLRGDIRITNIEAHSPVIHLQQKLDGRVNWQFTDATDDAQAKPSTAPAQATGEDTRAIAIARVTVTDARLTYDAEGSEIQSMEGVDLTLDWPDPEGPATIIAILRPASDPVTIRTAFDNLGDFIAGQVSPLRADLETPSGGLTLSGRASISGAVAGDFTLKTGSTDGFLRSLGLPGVDLPDTIGRSVDLSAQVTLTPDRKLALRNIRADLGGNSLTGAADIVLDAIPQINAQLDAGDLNLATMTRETKQGGGTSSVSKAPTEGPADGWSQAPIDASALAAFNGDIALSAQSIDLGSLRLGKTRAVLRNDTARMVFELREVTAYGGSVTGEFVVNNRSGLSVGGKIDAAAIEMQPLLSDVLDVDRLRGQGNLQLSFLGTGSSVDAIMRSLSGQGALAVGGGTIEGIDLDQLLRGGTTGGTTIFDDLTATWTIAGGVLSNRDLLLELKNYRASGAGQVGLGARNIDYRFTPVALRANSGKGLSVPVVFKGPWSDVSIRPDLEAALDLELDAQKDALEQRAREKISEKLGVTSSEDKSTEDALKDEVKDRLLRKLFD